MYTVKFMNNYPPSPHGSESTGNDAVSNTLVVGCDSYEVYRCQYHALVTVNGVEYRVHGHSNTGSSEDIPLPPYFDVAYVENMAGKTIERIGPYDDYDWQSELRINCGVREAA